MGVGQENTPNPTLQNTLWTFWCAFLHYFSCSPHLPLGHWLNKHSPEHKLRWFPSRNYETLYSFFSKSFYYFRKLWGPSSLKLVWDFLFEPHIGFTTLQLALLAIVLDQLFSFIRCKAEQDEDKRRWIYRRADAKNWKLMVRQWNRDREKISKVG